MFLLYAYQLCYHRYLFYDYVFSRLFKIFFCFVKFFVFFLLFYFMISFRYLPFIISSTFVHLFFFHYSFIFQFLRKKIRICYSL
ncbi:hypothetical protein C1645_774390 [Glomus cerebriforme]|uniref:Uncharacterized protein n=1 Tax=Glomus cerebriforme TaxID=658196 RepID=A0A397SY04_9GLOM|nr:hypothetical protein C1645_774390 [Glomus cerebriforme]